MAKGHIRKRGKNSWQIIYDAPRGLDGKRKQKSMTIHGTKKDAERKLREILTQIDQNTYVDSGKLTVEEFLLRWLRDYAKVNLAQSTVDGYEIIIKKHLIPALGKYQLDKLQPLHIQEYYARALANGRADGKGGLSPRTVLHHHRLLHRAFETALKWQLVSRNVCDAVEPPKVDQYESNVYDEEHIGKLIDLLYGTRLYIPVIITLATGLRRAEILALRWKDFNAQKKTITINQTLLKTSAGLQFKPPKTKKSRRTITLPEPIVEELKKHKKDQKKIKLRLGEAYEDNDLICCQEDGTPWHPGTFSSAFHDILEKHNLPHIRFHDLRHTHASILLKQGVHPKIVSERLGHSQIGITLDTYSHIMPGLQEEVANKLGQQLFNRLPDKKKKSN
ncbi:MAG: tyrosine-type recombinase/integrase [Desulfotomaculum sp.]|nr:tyrosine-type recombinase/integrase [Desulfotomaculum sp.]